jgi:periplasmic protein TonB
MAAVWLELKMSAWLPESTRNNQFMNVNPKKNRRRLFPALKVRHKRSWLMAGLVAMLANAGLFLLMPALISPTDVNPGDREMMSMINVIRLKKPELQAQKKEKSPPPPPPEPRPETKPRQQVMGVKMPRLSLPFETNQRLPALATDLKLPVAATAPINISSAVGEVEMGQLDAPQITLSRIPPMYPIWAQRRGIEGWVKVRFLIDKQGKVSSISIIEAKPPDLFDKSVRQCVARWRFKPGTVEGITVKSWMETKISFKLK